MSSQTCTISGARFQVSTAEEQLLSELGFHPNSIVPAERLRILLSFRGGRRLYTRRCEISGEEIRSIYPAKARFPVHAQELWWDRAWQPEQFARSFAPDQSFFVQLYDLWNSVPRPALLALDDVGGIDLDGTVASRHSLLVSDSTEIDRCAYSAYLVRCTLVIDSLFMVDCSRCYECIGCSRSSGLSWSENCSGCSDSAFLTSCIDCRNCYGCTNLVGASYCLYNRYVGPELIARFLAEHNLFNSSTDRRSIDDLREQAAIARRSHSVPHRSADDAAQGSGNYLYGQTHSENSYFLSDTKNVFHCFNLHNSAGCLDSIGLGSGLSDSYQAVSCSGTRVLTSIMCGGCSDIWYSSHCFDSTDLIGCVGLRGKHYCILNQQYSKEQFIEIRDWLVQSLNSHGIWGAFLTATFSGLCYNSSAAHEFMPLSPIQAELLQFDWDVELDAAPLASSEAVFSEAPASAAEALTRAENGELHRQRYICEISGRAFSISPVELELYRELSIPPPARGFEQRHYERLKRAAAGRLYPAVCAESGAELLTPFAPSARVRIVERGLWRQSLLTPEGGAL